MTEVYNNCDHDLHSDDNFCSKCGLELSMIKFDYSNISDINCHIHKNVKSFSFETELGQLDIPDEIKQRIIILSDTSSSITRKTPRKKLLFCYAYIAYLQLGKSFDPKKLGQIIGLKDSDYNDAISLASGLNSKPFSKCERVIVPMVIISPCDYIHDIIEEIQKIYGISLNENLIRDKLTLALENNKLLYENNPKSVAIGMIKYQLELDNIKTPKFNVHVNMNSAVIKKQIISIKEALGN